MLLIDFFDRGALGASSRECLVEGGLRLDYATVQAWTHRIAWALQREGVRAGDAVALLSPNSAWGYLAMLGLQRLGAVWVPLNARGAVAEWQAHMKRTGTRWLFVHEELASHVPQLGQGLLGHAVVGDPQARALRAWVERTPREPFAPQPLGSAQPVFRYTSSGGTTGAPKAIVQTQAGVAANVAAFIAVAGHREPRYLMCNPMTHAAGVLGLPVLALGGTIVFTRRPDPATLPATVAQERITCFMVTPTSIHALLERDDLGQADLSSLKYLMFGAAPMPPVLLKRALQRFGPMLMQLYAQSEASTMLAAMLPSDYAEVLAQPSLEHRLAAVGRPTPFARIAIMDDAGRLLPAGEDGEIVVRSAMVMQGYLGDPEGTEATRAHGWHHTGDVGHLDDDGFLYVVDRKRDLIISGGFNVFPSEVENFILTQAGVKECAVIGVKDERWGEAVKAVIVAAEGDRLDLAALESACRAHFGGVKCPKTFDVWPELPRSHLGKVLKRAIRERYE